MSLSLSDLFFALRRGDSAERLYVKLHSYGVLQNLPQPEIRGCFKRRHARKIQRVSAAEIMVLQQTLYAGWV